MLDGSRGPTSSLEEPFTATHVFKVPVDSECKAKSVWPLWSFAVPHHRAFQLAWMSFFITFFAAFAPAALLPPIRDNLNLTASQLNNAGITAVVGAIAARAMMGPFLDTVGPRYAVAYVLCFISPAVFLMSMVTTYGGFAAARLIIGISLGVFVSTQYWVGSMFSVNIVGTANAIAGGWGNMGGGATLLLMPLFYAGIENYGSGMQGFSAWRWSFFIPGAAFLVVAGFSVMFTQDGPLGDFRDLKKHGLMAKGQGMKVLMVGISNYRTWIMALTYGYCFGVELTIDNIIVSYLFDQFGLNLTTAGALGAIFGLMNIFSRATGGALSDFAALHFGMRGRLWTLWTLQTISGGFCIALSYVDYGLGPTIAVMIIFSVFVQQAAGATYGIVPFISRRAYGVTAGVVGAGGNTGSAICQALWFGASFPYQMIPGQPFTVPDGLKYMGVMMLGVTTALMFLHFPMWGSMFFPGNPDITEEDYYIKEWTAEEVSTGLHVGSMRFANESRSQRYGSRNSSVRGFKANDSSVTKGPKQVALSVVAIKEEPTVVVDVAK